MRALERLKLPAAELQALATFHPFELKRFSEALEDGRRFVHYTSATVGMSILKKKEVWMRNSSTMNDFSEVEYGMHCTAQVWNGPIGAKLRGYLDDLFPGSTQRLHEYFNGWLPHFRSHTYLACMSEHLDNEDTIGRLSMWRAYGGQTGVAIVMNQRPFLAPSHALGAYTSPVEYLTAEGFADEFAKMAGGLIRAREYLQELGEETVIGSLIRTLRSAVLCTKHPGFAEEREWRVIYSPMERPSQRLKTEITDIRGIPQRIYRIPLVDVPEENLIGIEPAQLIDRIIIGPNKHPRVVEEAFVYLLIEAGVPNARERVVVSDIPLRQ